MAKQEIADVYANVRDERPGPRGLVLPGASGNGRDDDTAAIQRAIDNAEGKHVLVPAGQLNTQGVVQPYVIKSPLRFTHEGQRCLFLAGALLQLESDDARVEILAPGQHFVGLAIQGGTDQGERRSAVPDPCLLISGADGLLLEDLSVSGGAAKTVVRVTGSNGVTIDRGRIFSGGPVVGRTGLEIGEGVRGFGATGLAVDQHGVGVRFVGTSRAVAFLASTIEGVCERSIEVMAGAKAHALSLQAVHMEAGYVGGGATEFIVVRDGGGLYGAAFRGCIFGAWLEGAATACIFNIEGEVQGASVSGCQHMLGPSTHVVWNISGTVSGVCDAFNYWDGLGPNTGANSAGLVGIASNFGAVAVTATTLRLDVAKLGFFGVTPVAQPDPYTLGTTALSRDAASGDVREVLTQLLSDLAALGLVTKA